MSKSKQTVNFMQLLKTLTISSVLGTGGLFLISIRSSVALPSASLASSSLQPVAFEDIKGVFGEKEITQLGQLGVFSRTTGKFNPQQPITRAEFMRWVVRANNALWFDQPDKMIREAEGGQATFTDVPPTHPDFRYIQGLTNTGFLSGFDGTTFKPDALLTREQLIAIKVGIDLGGGPTYDSESIDRGVRNILNWTDKTQISRKFIPAFLAEHSNSSFDIYNTKRIFGAIKTFKPQAPVTRVEAAICVSGFGNHGSGGLFKWNFRTTEEVLKLKADLKSSHL